MSGIAERLAEALAGSHDVWLGDAYGHHGVEVSQELADHLADALLPVVEREIAAARGEAWLEGHASGRDYQGDGWNSDVHDPARDNPYRAALSPDPDCGEVRMHNHPASKQCGNDCPSGHPSAWSFRDEHRFRAEDET